MMKHRNGLNGFFYNVVNHNLLCELFWMNAKVINGWDIQF